MRGRTPSPLTVSVPGGLLADGHGLLVLGVPRFVDDEALRLERFAHCPSIVGRIDQRCEQIGRIADDESDTNVERRLGVCARQSQKDRAGAAA